MTDPDRDRRERSIGRMSVIALILAFVVMLLGIIYNRPTPAGTFIESTGTTDAQDRHSAVDR
jgi:hypothetical protein